MRPEKKKRYNVKTHVNALLEEMDGIIPYHKSIAESSKTFAEALIQQLTRHVNVAENFDIEYKKLSPVITKMEALYEKEKTLLDYYTTLAAKKTLKKDIIRKSLHDILIRLEKMSEESNALCKQLRSIAKKSPYKQDKKAYNQKIDAFRLFFRDIDNDIMAIYSKQEDLIK